MKRQISSFANLLSKVQVQHLNSMANQNQLISLIKQSEKGRLSDSAFLSDKVSQNDLLLNKLYEQ
jgi:hypothetical protein